MCLQRSGRTIHLSHKIRKLSHKIRKLQASKGEDVVAVEDKGEEVRLEFERVQLEDEVPLRLKCVLYVAINAIKAIKATARQSDRESETGIGGLVYGAPSPTF